MVGLNSAGKAINLYKLEPKGSKTIPINATLNGFILEYLYYEDLFFTVLDLGASIPYKPIWNYYHSHN